MNVNEVAMPQYKPSEVTILQDKSKFIANERATSQYVSSEQGQSHPSMLKMNIPIESQQTLITLCSTRNNRVAMSTMHNL